MSDSISRYAVVLWVFLAAIGYLGSVSCYSPPPPADRIPLNQGTLCFSAAFLLDSDHVRFLYAFEQGRASCWGFSGCAVETIRRKDYIIDHLAEKGVSTQACFAFIQGHPDLYRAQERRVNAFHDGFGTIQ